MRSQATSPSSCGAAWTGPMEMTTRSSLGLNEGRPQGCEGPFSLRCSTNRSQYVDPLHTTTRLCCFRHCCLSASVWLCDADELVDSSLPIVRENAGSRRSACSWVEERKPGPTFANDRGSS